MNEPRAWSIADDELERLAQFISEYFPSQRQMLNPVAAPRPRAVVNVAIKLLLQAFGVGGRWPVRFTLSGQRRHYLDPTTPTEAPRTFCGHQAYTLAEMIKKGIFNPREAAKMRDAEECGRCRENQKSVVTVSDKEMSDVAARLRALEAELD